MGTTQVVVTVDIAVFRETVQGLEILLIQRRKQPYAGQWALPGGKLEEQDRTLEDAVRRELWEETGVDEVGMVQEVDAFGDVGRDPRGRYVSVLYASLLDSPVALWPESDAMDVGWFPVPLRPSPLAFDHDRLLSTAYRFICNVRDLL